MPGRYFVCKAKKVSAELYTDGRILFVSSDGIEVTYVATCPTHMAPIKDRRGPFALIRLRVDQPFQAFGFLASISSAIARRRISILIYSTFSFDYVLVRLRSLNTAVQELRKLGLRKGRP